MFTLRGLSGLLIALVVVAVYFLEPSECRYYGEEQTNQLDGYENERVKKGGLSSQELEADVNRITNLLEREKQRKGYDLDLKDYEKFDKDMESVPWYKKFARFVKKQYKAVKKSAYDTFG